MVMSPTNGSSPDRHTPFKDQVSEPIRPRSVSRVAGLRNVSPALQFGYHKHRQLEGDSSPLDGLEALKHAANQRDRQTAKALQRIGRQVTPRHTELDHHAAPLTPLRDRDTTALSEWFGQTNMAQIEADIAHCLLVLWPAPCWEDNPFEFLEEYL